jgi:hypothetical protein
MKKNEDLEKDISGIQQEYKVIEALTQPNSNSIDKKKGN